MGSQSMSKSEICAQNGLQVCPSLIACSPYATLSHTLSPSLQPRDLRRIDSRISNVVPSILVRDEAIIASGLTSVVHSSSWKPLMRLVYDSSTCSTFVLWSKPIQSFSLITRAHRLSQSLSQPNKTLALQHSSSVPLSCITCLRTSATLA